MGNRAIIVFGDSNSSVYLHWNGGISSVTAFLKYCELRGFREPDKDDYGIARFVQVVANYFGADGLSIGIVDRPDLNDVDSYGLDNGIYVVHGWKITQHYGKMYFDKYDLTDMIIAIDVAQPENQQLLSKQLGDMLTPAVLDEMDDNIRKVQNNNIRNCTCDY